MKGQKPRCREAAECSSFCDLAHKLSCKLITPRYYLCRATPCRPAQNVPTKVDKLKKQSYS